MERSTGRKGRMGQSLQEGEKLSKGWLRRQGTQGQRATGRRAPLSAENLFLNSVAVTV